MKAKINQNLGSASEELSEVFTRVAVLLFSCNFLCSSTPDKHLEGNKLSLDKAQSLSSDLQTVETLRERAAL